MPNIKILKNGLKIIMIPLNVKTISIGFFVKTGSRYETSQNNGIAHFLEHMYFRGTQTKNTETLLSELENIGAIYNAMTSFEYTCYIVSGNYIHNLKLLDIMIDIYMNPKFDTHDIEIEKGVVKDEINMTLDDYTNIGIAELYKLLYNGTTLSYQIIGNKKNIDNIKQEDLFKFKKQFYKPNNTTIVIAGKFDTNITKIIKNKMGSLTYKKINSFPSAIVKQHIPNISIKYDNTKTQSIFYIAFKTINGFEYDSYVLDIIGGILSKGSMSRLFKRLRGDMGITYFNVAEQESFHDVGHFYIHSAVQTSRANDAMRVVIEELHNLKTNLVTCTELERIKTIIESSKLFTLETPNDYMMYYGLQDLYFGKKSKSLDEIIKIYKNVTDKDILDVSNKYFTLDTLNISIYGSINKDILLEDLVLLDP